MSQRETVLALLAKGPATVSALAKVTGYPKRPHGYRLTPQGLMRCRRAMRYAAQELGKHAGDPSLADLWISGRVFRVDPEVVAHFKFLSDNLASIARQAARYAAELRERPGRSAA